MASIPVGILHSQSGTMSLSESPLIDVTLMAITEINQAGGVLGHSIHPIIEDGASNPAVFACKARKLICDDQVATVFGCWTSATRKAVLAIFEENNALLWYPLQYEGLESSKNIFYIGSCPNQQVEPAVNWLLQHQKKRFYLIGSDYVFPRTVNKILQGQLQQQGGEVVGERYVDLGETEFKQIIAQIRQLRPDVAFNTLNGDSNQAFYRQYREAGITAHDIPIMAVSVAEAELRNIREAAVGHYSSWSYFQSLPNPENTAFVRNFQTRYGRHCVTSDPVEAAYAQVYLWKQAVEAAQSLAVDAVRRAAYGQSFQAPGGPITIEPNHHVWKDCYIGKVLPSGQFEIVFSSDAPIKPLPWLGVEEQNFAASELVIDMLGEVSQSIQQTWLIEQKTRKLTQTTARLRQEIVERRRAEEEVQLLLTIAQSISSASSFRAALEAALRHICQATGWIYGELWMPGEDESVLRCTPIWYFDSTQQDRATIVALGAFRQQTERITCSSSEGIFGRVWQSQRPEWIQSLPEEDSEVFVRATAAKPCGFRGAFGVPIICPMAGERPDAVLAVMVFLFPELRKEDERWVKIISAVAAQLGTVVQQKQTEETLRQKNEELAVTLQQLQSTQSQLMQSRTLLSSVLNSSHDGVIAIESVRDRAKIIDFRCLLVNSVAAQALSHFTDDLTGKSLKPFIDRLDPQLFQWFVQVVETGNVLEKDFGSGRNGNQSWFHFVAVKLSDGFVITFRDITERKQMELALQKANSKLHRQARLDSLTQVANRRLFDERLVQEWQRASREQQPLSIILCDIDYFKHYNDFYGHQAGDDCLQRVATGISRAVKRPADLVARYGGEEFAVILPNTSLEGASRVAEQIRQEIQQLKLNHAASAVSQYVSVSIGVSSRIPSQEPLEMLVADADTALYKAKEQGRNRVVRAVILTPTTPTEDCCLLGRRRNARFLDSTQKSSSPVADEKFELS
ncbi:MAG: urea ABC transporter substrate-binding protein [Cyanophyceae cyanobacterium]